MGFLDRFKSDGPKPPDSLTFEIVARLRVLASTETVEPVDADTVAVTWADSGDQTTVDLTDLRTPWKRTSGFERIELLDEFVDGVTAAPAGAPVFEESAPEPAVAVDPAPEVADEPAPLEEPSEWEQLRPSLLPALQPVGVAGPDAVAWPFGDAVQIVVVRVDDETPVGRGELEALGVSEDDLDAAAGANLEALDPAVEPIGAGTRAWVATAPPGLQSSWLLAPHRLLASCGLGAAIGFAPLPGELVVIDPDDAELVRSIAASTLRILERQPGTLLPLPVSITDDSVDLWDPPEDHPAAPTIAEMQERFAHPS